MHTAGTHARSHSATTAAQGLRAWHVCQLTGLKVVGVLCDIVMPMLSAYHVIHNACIRIRTLHGQQHKSTTQCSVQVHSTAPVMGILDLWRACPTLTLRAGLVCAAHEACKLDKSALVSTDGSKCVLNLSPFLVNT